MKDIHNIHDKTFKTAMSDIRVARDFFEEYLTKTILSLVNLNTLKLSHNSYVDENLNTFSSDVLYEVKLENSNTAYFYLLCEHQSSVDRLMPFRLLNYMVRIWSDYLKQTGHKNLPLIYPLVFYHGEDPYHGPRSLPEIVQALPAIIEDVLFKPFHLMDTHEIEDERLRERRWAGILTFMMKHVYARDIWPFIQTVIEMLKNIEKEEGAAIYANHLLKYWLLAAEIKKEPKASFIETIKQGLSASMRSEMMTIAEQLIQQGIHQGEARLLATQLKVKFKELPESYMQKINSADLTTLNRWAINFVNAQSLNEVFEK